jgi:hypothetical protein
MDDNLTKPPVEKNSINEETSLSEKQKDNYLNLIKIGLILTTGLVLFLTCLLILVLLFCCLGKKIPLFQKNIFEGQNQIPSILEEIVPSPKFNEDNSSWPKTANCISTFSSKYIKLVFNYDSCLWEINENLEEAGSGVYSKIVAKHNSNHQIIIKANDIGMGGGYPGCLQVGDISIIDNNIVRVQIPENQKRNTQEHYLYLTKENEYGIKDYPGEFGDQKFREYLEILPDLSPDVNMCWRGVGINTVPILLPKTSEDQSKNIENLKDLTISIEEGNILDKQFLKDADSLVVSIYSSISK